MSPAPARAAAPDRRHGARRGAAAPRVPRRVSGPARPRMVATGGAVALPRPGGGQAALGRRALRRALALVDHPLLVRLLTGRAWIALIGCALIGIVFMQVSLLKLNAGIGRSVERAAVLDRENADLRDVVSRLGSDERLQAEAAKMGLELPPAGAVTFLGRNGHRVGGDADIALATGTATGPQPAGVGAGQLAPTATAPGVVGDAAPAAPSPGTGGSGTAASAATTSAQAAQPTQQQPAQSQPTQQQPSSTTTPPTTSSAPAASAPPQTAAATTQQSQSQYGTGGGTSP
jgi:hypothetical protein